jgi:ornithine cyclodeaminase
LLAEHGYLTDLRTAAAVGLTLKYLAPKGARDALLVGAGAVGRLAARAIVAQLPIENLTVWNRTQARAETLVRDLVDSGTVKARVTPALEPEVRRHRVIVTATASTTPLIKAAWVAKGTHITSVGTGSPEKVELEPALLVKADKLIADSRRQTAQYGNLHHAITAGVLKAEDVYGELGDLAAGRLPGRERDDEITIADLTGVGVQDAAIAAVVVEALGL